MTHAPVSSISDLRTLDPEEMAEGYVAGLHGASEPDDAHTRAFWHGWRNGCLDAGLRARDEADRSLARSFVIAARMHLRVVEDAWGESA